MKLIGDRLRELREKKNLKQIQVMRSTGVNNKTLSGYENGVSEPDFDTLKVLANFYEVSTDYILGKTDDPTPAATQQKSLEERKAAAMAKVAEKFGFDLTKEEDFKIIEQLLETAAKIRGL